MAKCLYCQEKAGWFKPVCAECKQMLGAVQALGNGFSFRGLLDALIATGASNAKIEKFLEADIGGQGSIRDLITARMTNELAQRVGQPTDTDAQKVRQIREEEKKRPQLPLKPGQCDPLRR
ncbi:MAG: hypothetical protein U1F66_13220 [bacterium]